MTPVILDLKYQIYSGRRCASVGRIYTQEQEEYGELPWGKLSLVRVVLIPGQFVGSKSHQKLILPALNKSYLNGQDRIYEPSIIPCVKIDYANLAIALVDVMDRVCNGPSYFSVTVLLLRCLV